MCIGVDQFVVVLRADGRSRVDCPRQPGTALRLVPEHVPEPRESLTQTKTDPGSFGG